MLDLRGIRKIFNPKTSNEVRALEGVDLTLDDGSFVIIIGSNGSGKSTLLNCVAGTFFVDTGSITLGGHDVTRWPEHRRAALIGRVFQNPFSGTAPGMTIAENLSLAARRGRPAASPDPAHGYLDPSRVAAPRRTHGGAGSEKRGPGDCADRCGRRAGKVDNSDGDALHVAGREPGRPPHHDAPRKNHSGLPRS